MEVFWWWCPAYLRLLLVGGVPAKGGNVRLVARLPPCGSIKAPHTHTGFTCVWGEGSDTYIDCEVLLYCKAL